MLLSSESKEKISQCVFFILFAAGLLPSVSHEGAVRRVRPVHLSSQPGFRHHDLTQIKMPIIRLLNRHLGHCWVSLCICPSLSVGEVWRRKKQGWTVLFYMYLVSLIKFHKVDLWSVKIPQLLHLSPTLPSFKPKHPPKIMARGCNTINQLTISKAEIVH